MRPWLVLALVLVDDGPHQPLAALGARDAVVVGGGWWASQPWRSLAGGPSAWLRLEPAL